MPSQPFETDLAIVGAGVAACTLVATLRRRGWSGSITLIESGRGPGGRAATRRSRHDPGLRINHGAPLFNLTAPKPPPLIAALEQGGWIRPFDGSLASIGADGVIAPLIPSAGDAGFTQGSLWQGCDGMDQLAAGLLALGAAHPGRTTLRFNAVVTRLQPCEQGGAPAWILHERSGASLLRCRWLVLSGTLLAHPRCQTLLGWDEVPLQQAAAALNDLRLDQACSAMAAIETSASSNLLLSLPPELSKIWQGLPWRLLQFSPEAQQRFGLRRVSVQEQGEGRWAVVAESSAAFADRYRDVLGAGSSAARMRGSAHEPDAERRVIDCLDQALGEAVGLATTTADRQLMRWGAAFPEPPGLPAELQLCPDSHIGFCGDAVAGEGFARLEGAICSAAALAEALLQELGRN
jgi:predicted NAD/FAD-dependent oxidoreductase